MAERELPLYSRTSLPGDDADWRRYRKMSLTRAVRIEGPFRVETSESENEPFRCEDGYLAIDARGYPYAIAAEEFVRIYVAADHGLQVDSPTPGTYWIGPDGGGAPADS